MSLEASRSTYLALLALHLIAQIPLSKMMSIKMNRRQWLPRATKSPPMLAMSKASSVMLVLAGILEIASSMAAMEVALTLVVALNSSSAVYSRVSFKSYFELE